ncbi:MAG: tRNA (adenosine(37)-N6)-dimethylallyltransferase MiaA [Ruminococcaceae bacterium]|nr:tRNA (adenosine(37)-N6)-dimethylallyltransferase MiaA [Oscillospiraceae bacterium]
MSQEIKKIPVVVIVGPTASGKTGLAIEVAKKFDGEIVSADSMQVYKGFPIASAAPTEYEKSIIPHHLVEFLEPSVKFSVADYVKFASKCIYDINRRGKLPVIAGGTGLYINSLIDGIPFGEKQEDEKLRQSIEEEYDLLGGEKMLQKMAEFDSETASRLSSGDKRRIVRAFEIYRSTGITITKQNELSKLKASPYKPTIIGITYEDRQKLYDRINSRVDLMLKNGLINEAKQFSEDNVTASQAIGHKELMPYLRGEISLEEAVETLKRETRRYAKRQLTWFRRDTRINWIYADKEDVLKKTFSIIKEGMK